MTSTLLVLSVCNSQFYPGYRLQALYPDGRMLRSFIVDLPEPFVTVGSMVASAAVRLLVADAAELRAFVMLPHHDMPPNFGVDEVSSFERAEPGFFARGTDPVALAARLKLGAEILLMALAAAMLEMLSPAAPNPIIGAGMTVLLGFSALYAGFAILVWSQAGGGAAPARDAAFWLRQTAALVGIVALHAAFRFSLAYPLQPHYPSVAFPAAVALILLASRGMPDLSLSDHLRCMSAPLLPGLVRRAFIPATVSSSAFQPAGAGKFDACLALRPLHKEAADDTFVAPAAGGGELGQRYGGSPPAERYLSEWEEVQKSTFDLTLATLLLPFLCPVMLVIAAAIFAESRGPVLFRQPRAGLDGRTFTIYKFRTMYHHMADIGADRQTSPGDPRVTRVGRILRRYSLDELPQLLNVFRGDMSLVGPRPHAPQTKAAGVPFAQAVQEYYIRQSVKPGITGWAQVNGSRGEVTTIHQLRKRVAYDLFYIMNWSVFFDIKIIVLTIRREVFSQHAF